MRTAAHGAVRKACDCDKISTKCHHDEGSIFSQECAIVLAGAQTLLMRLWKVPDEQTKELMVDFYKRLMSGKSRAKALREAHLAMKEKEKYTNPYYWGAFNCQGNPGPLVSNQNQSTEVLPS